MNDDLFTKKCLAILESLDKAIAEGPWEDSNYLRVVGKKLQKIRDELVEETQLSHSDVTRNAAMQAEQVAFRAGQKEIYISLYASDGNNLKVWERILSNLGNQTISRPIYAHENEVQNIIRVKEHKENEAYVALFINQNDLLTLSEDKISYDKLGCPLLTLKNKSIKIENMTRFVHLSQTFRLDKGGLVKV